MQVLDFAFVTVLASGFALYAYLFIAGWNDRPSHSTPAIQPTEATVDEVAETVAPAWTNTPIADEFIISDVQLNEAIEWDAEVVEVAEVQAIDWSTVNKDGLRSACVQSGIQWRRKVGKKKYSYMSVEEMRSALSQKVPA